MKALADRDFMEAAALVRADEDDPWTPARLEEALAPFAEEHGRVIFDARARQPHYLTLTKESDKLWRVRQTLCDRSDEDLWMFEAELELSEIQAADEPWLRLVRIGT